MRQELSISKVKDAIEARLGIVGQLASVSSYARLVRSLSAKLGLRARLDHLTWRTNDPVDRGSGDGCYYHVETDIVEGLRQMCVARIEHECVHGKVRAARRHPYEQIRSQTSVHG